MKTEIVIATIVLGTLVVSLSGCKKEEAAPAAPAAAAIPAAADAPKPIEAMTNEAAKIVDTATPAAKAVTDQATTQANAAQQQTQGLIDKAKGYVADQKYQDALSTISQLSASKLTPDQQTLLDALKAQIQSAMAKTSASDATSVLGGALGGKK